MADYTSTQNGNWSNDATWGGGGHPSSNDDTATIAHEVTYDMGDSAITWGNVTINSGGILIFPIAANSTILFNATGILTVNSGGELRAGTSGAPIGAAYHCYLHWPQGAAYRDVLVLNDGGTMNLYGDPDLYGSTRYANLDSDWTAGQTLYVTGDLSALWASGQKFFIHKNALYNDYTTDSAIYTINTVGAYDSANNRTPVTIVEAAPGVTYAATAAGHTSELILVSRNIVLCDPGATLNVGYNTIYTERIRFDNNQSSSNTKVNIHDCLFYGWDYALNGGYNTIINRTVYAVNDDAFYLVYQSTIDADMLTNKRAIYLMVNSTFSGNFAANNGAAVSISNSIFTADFISNYVGLSASTDISVAGNFISNRSGIEGDKIAVTGNFILNLYGISLGGCTRVTGDFISNTYGISSSDNITIIGDFTTNTSDIYNSDAIVVNGALAAGSNSTYASSTDQYRIVYSGCTFAGVLREYRIYVNSGTILPLVTGDGDWVSPDSENEWILQLTPNSNCSTRFNMRIALSPLHDMAIYCPAGTHTLTFKIYPAGWTTALDQDDIYVLARYLAASSGIERTTVQTSAQTFANAGWRECSVTFTTGQEGIVYFNLYCTAYEAGKYILIDPQWIISPKTGTLAAWAIHDIITKYSHGIPAAGTSLEGKIYATLTADASVTSHVSERIYPQHRPQNESLPALTYFRVGGQRDNDLDGYTHLENPRVSIEVYATAIDARRELGDAVISAMCGSTRFSAISALSPLDMYDDTIQEYKRILDFSIWNHDT